MLDSTLSTVGFGMGALILGRLIGSPHKPQIEIPEGVPPEIVAEWRRLSGAPMPDATEGRRGRKLKPPPRPVAVELKKGLDGIYRPTNPE
jgi:hypothetical protein